MLRIGFLLIVLASSPAHADDNGFTLGAFAGPGVDSRPGYRTGFELEVGDRSGKVEWAVAPRLMVIGSTPVFEADLVIRVFFAPRTYGEFAGGLALLPGETGGDAIHTPNAQPSLGLGFGHNLVRSDRWRVDVRVLYALDIGFKIDNEKSTIHAILVGPAVRFY